MLNALQVTKTTKLGKHRDGGGLFLQVTSGKHGIAKSWVLASSVP
jgi:hypothetical protein